MPWKSDFPSKGATPETMPTASSRSGIEWAQTAAMGSPPGDTDHREARQPKVGRQMDDVGRPIQQAMTGLRSEPPIPGRSTAIKRAPASSALACANAASTRDPGKPWK